MLRAVLEVIGYLPADICCRVKERSKTSCRAVVRNAEIFIPFIFPYRLFGGGKDIMYLH